MESEKPTMNDNIKIEVDAEAATIKLEQIDDPDFNFTDETDELQEPIKIEPQIEIKIDSTPINEELLLSYCEDITDPFATLMTSNSKTTPKIPKDCYVTPNSCVKFKCSQCFGQFLTRFERDEHKKIHKQQQKPIIATGTYKCSLCTLEFSTFQLRNEHKKSDHPSDANNPKFECQPCKIFFTTEDRLHFHNLRLHRPKKQQINVLKPEITEEYKCMQAESPQPLAIVEKSPVITAAYSLQIEIEHKCTKCSQTFSTSAKVRIHEKCHGDKWACRICLAGFKTKPFLLIHRSRMHPIKVNCSKCDEIFTTENARDRHEIIHGDDWPCLLCPAGFRSKQSVLNHRDKFHPEAEQYTYVSNSTLKDVAREVQKSESTMSKVRNKKAYKKIYKCKKCPAAYEGKVGLRNHVKTHGVEWICELCPVGYKSQIGLKYHWKAEHPEAKKYRWKKQKPDKRLPQPTQGGPNVKFRCTKCGLTFRNVYQRNYHLSHQKCKGLKSAKVPCGWCPAIFSTVVGAKNHRRIIHGDLRTSSVQVSDKEETFTVQDPLSFVTVSMEDVKPNVIFETSDKNEESKGRVNPHEIFVKTELNELICLKSETD